MKSVLKRNIIPILLFISIIKINYKSALNALELNYVEDDQDYYLQLDEQTDYYDHFSLIDLNNNHINYKNNPRSSILLQLNKELQQVDI